MMRKRNGLLPVLVMVLSIIVAYARPVKPKFRVIGYVRLRGLDNSIKNVDLGKITHLNIAFINPDSLGNLPITTGLKTVADIAHKKGVKVLISIGGGAPPKYLPELLYGDKEIVFIAALMKMVADNNLDGIDVDLEGRMVDKSYEGFVCSLANALKEKNKLITAAIATYYADRYTDKSLAFFDFVNVMSYDKTGPWNLNKPGQHSPYDMAVNDMDYWGKHGIAKEKLSLGVPFYGYGFGPDVPESMSYKDIISQNPGSENDDQVTLPGGGTVYYNGAKTIKAKTELALKTSGGIMMWQLMQDAEGEKSLLGIIDATIKANKK